MGTVSRSSSSVSFLLFLSALFLLPIPASAQGPYGQRLDDYRSGGDAKPPEYQHLEQIAGQNPDNAGLQVFTQMMGANSNRKKASRARSEASKGLKDSCEKANRINQKYQLGGGSDCSQYNTQEAQQSDAEQMQDNINQTVAYGALAIGIVQAFQYKAVESPQQKAAREAQLQRVHKTLDKGQAVNQRLQASTEGLKKRMAALKALEPGLDGIDATLKKLGQPDPKSRARRTGAMVGFNTNSPAVRIKDNGWNTKRKLELADVPPPTMSGDSIKEARAAANDRKQEVRKELEVKTGEVISAVAGDVSIERAKETAARMEADTSRNPGTRVKSGGDVLGSRPARAGDRMQPGDTITTGPNGRAQLTFPDGAVVWIKENSTFKMMEVAPATSKKMNPLFLKKNAEFRVHTSNAVAAVRG